MQPQLSMHHWLAALNQIVPAHGIVYVGAGSGSSASAFCTELAAEAVLLIEADEQHAVRLAETVRNKANWTAAIALVADTEKLTDFHRASSLNESSLIQPEKLVSLWRNLQQRETLHMQSRTLDQLCAIQSGSARFNWAVIDCFPAATLLAGAGANLATWDVVLARVTLENSEVDESGASKDEVDVLLAAAGYRCLAIQSERHPAVGMALYARDWKQVLAGQLAQAHEERAKLEEEKSALAGRHEEQAKLAAERGTQIEALQAAQGKLEEEKSALAGRHEEQAKLAAERQAQLEQLAQAKAAVELELSQEIEALKQAQAQREQDIAQLMQARDGQAQLAVERQAALDALAKEMAELAQAKAQLESEKSALAGRHDEQAKLATERQAQLEQLAQAKAAVELERGQEIEALKQTQAQREQAIAQLTQARDGQAQLAAERQTALDALTKEKADLAQAKAQLESEKSALAGRHDEQAKLAAERLKQLNEIQQQIQSRQAGEAELVARQQLMHEEMVRAEAQIDLIKDLLLREPGL